MIRNELSALSLRSLRLAVNMGRILFNRRERRDSAEYIGGMKSDEKIESSKNFGK